MKAPIRSIFIDQGNGTYKKYEGPIEDLLTLGWPSFAPAGSVPQDGSAVSVAFDHVYSRQGLGADLMTFKPPTEADWAAFSRFLAIRPG
jgi:hypothetical protein